MRRLAVLAVALANPEIVETPEQPDRQAFQSDSAVRPSAVTAPTPVSVLHSLTQARLVELARELGVSIPAGRN